MMMERVERIIHDDIHFCHETNMGIVLPDSLALPKQLSAFVQLSFSSPLRFLPVAYLMEGQKREK